MDLNETSGFVSILELSFSCFTLYLFLEIKKTSKNEVYFIVNTISFKKGGEKTNHVHKSAVKKIGLRRNKAKAILSLNNNSHACRDCRLMNTEFPPELIHGSKGFEACQAGGEHLFSSVGIIYPK